MIKKKVCMIGAFAAGKTSLVQKFVYSIFSEKYLTTIGVKVDKKSMTLQDKTIDLILWDLHGEDDFQDIRPSYLKGSSGLIFVVDGTRQNTLPVALRLMDMTREICGTLPYIFAINKCDLQKEWDIESRTLDRMNEEGYHMIQTSAKTGHGVQIAFERLAEQMIAF